MAFISVLNHTDVKGQNVVLKRMLATLKFSATFNSKQVTLIFEKFYLLYRLRLKALGYGYRFSQSQHRASGFVAMVITLVTVLVT